MNLDIYPKREEGEKKASRVGRAVWQAMQAFATITETTQNSEDVADEMKDSGNSGHEIITDESEASGDSGDARYACTLARWLQQKQWHCG